jgi:hypothetical protein
LALVSLNLGTYADFTFHVSTFSFVASSMACNTIVTLLVFGMKNVALSFYEPGSLVTLVSAVCCVHTDAETLAVLKGSYSILGQSFGKYKPNETVKKYLKEQRKSMVDFPQAANVQRLAANVVVPAPTEGPEAEKEGDDVSGPGLCAPFVLEGMDAWPHRSAEGEASAAGSISRCAPFEMQARPHPTRPGGTLFYFPHGWDILLG